MREKIIIRRKRSPNEDGDGCKNEKKGKCIAIIEVSSEDEEEKEIPKIKKDCGVTTKIHSFHQQTQTYFTEEKKVTPILKKEIQEQPKLAKVNELILFKRRQNEIYQSEICFQNLTNSFLLYFILGHGPNPEKYILINSLGLIQPSSILCNNISISNKFSIYSIVGDYFTIQFVQVSTEFSESFNESHTDKVSYWNAHSANKLPETHKAYSNYILSEKCHNSPAVEVENLETLNYTWTQVGIYFVSSAIFFYFLIWTFNNWYKIKCNYDDEL